MMTLTRRPGQATEHTNSKAAMIMKGPEVLRAVCELLGCSRTEHPVQSPSSSSPEEEQPVIDTARISSCISLACPSLDLKHEHSTKPRAKLRAQAEEHAVALLSRPLQLHVSAQGNCSLEEEAVPELLLQNVYESFAKLVHSRLRAYSSLIARHGMTLSEKELKAAGIEEKLERLFQVAGAINAEEMVTSFDCQDVEGVDIDGHGTANSSSFPLTLRIALDLVLPSRSGGGQIVKVGVSCPGEIKGNDKTIKVELDTHKLLVGLVEQAAHVVDAIAEVSTDATSLPTSDMPRTASFLAMPPPKSRGPQDPHEALSYEGLELLSKAAAALPVVSPSISGGCGQQQTVPTLQLDVSLLNDHKDQVDDVAEMSVDQCADIVDNIFGEGGIDDSVFHHHHDMDHDMDPPSNKRTRIY